ncbi:MAG: Ig-like domain-containing protein [Kiritimatiellae bacterium]|nr:Ig-like domain-containing protein [Kiritimatiellia bacterium]
MKMKHALILIFLISITACQSRRVGSFRVENALGDPVQGATVTMASMNSGQPAFSELTTNEDGVALLPFNISIGPSFLFQILFEGKFYSFGYEDVHWQHGTPVIRLRTPY